MTLCCTFALKMIAVAALQKKTIFKAKSVLLKKQKTKIHFGN